MAAPTRQGPLGTLRSVVEDLRAVREAGGLDRASEETLAGTLAAMMARRSGTGPPRASLAEAIDLAKGHVASVCRSLADGAEGDPAKIATARSAEALLLRDRSNVEKHEAVRRKILREVGCSISTDALRKREDTLLKAIATAMLDDIEHTGWALRRPSTIEELVLASKQGLIGLADQIQIVAKVIYPIGALEVDADALRRAFGRILYDIGVLQWLARTAHDLMSKGQARSSTQVRLVNSMFELATAPLGSTEDRALVAELYQRHRADRESFIDEVADGDGSVLISAALEWLGGCHVSCAFERSFVEGLLCPMHHYVVVLRTMAERCEDLASGRYEREVEAEQAVLEKIDDGTRAPVSFRPT